jgi:hypothetical protein
MQARSRPARAPDGKRWRVDERERAFAVLHALQHPTAEAAPAGGAGDSER